MLLLNLGRGQDGLGALVTMYALVLTEPINSRMVNSEAPQTGFWEVTGADYAHVWQIGISLFIGAQQIRRFWTASRKLTAAHRASGWLVSLERVLLHALSQC